MHGVKRMEWKKTFGSPLLLTAIGILFLANGILFWQAQRKDNRQEVGKCYLEQLVQCLETYPDGAGPDECGALLTQVSAQNERLETLHFLASYEEARKQGQNTAYYELMYDSYVTDKGIALPDTLPDTRIIRSRVQASRILLEQITYLAGYPDTISRILENAERMGKIDRFAADGSFSKRNIQRTAKDFAEMSGLVPKLVPALGISAWLAEERTDYFVLAVLLLIAAEFFRERKKGLWHIVHAGAAGRFPLALRRIGVLTAGGIFLVLTFYGSTLLLSFRIYGEAAHLHGIFSAPVQSLPEFGQCVLSVTAGQFLLLRFLLKMSVLAAFGVLFYAVMSVFSSAGGAVMAAGAVLGFEFLAYRFIPVQSFANVFKFINLFPLLSGTKIFTEYQNLNLFAAPVSSLTGAYVGLLILFLCASAIGIRIHVRKFPVSGVSLFSAAADGWKKKLAGCFRPAGILRTELFKQMVSGRGLIVLIIFTAVMLRLLPSGEVFYSAEDSAMRRYCLEFEGEVTKETLAFLELQRQRLADGELSPENEILALRFETYIQELLDYEEEHGTKLFVVNPFGYQAYYSPLENTEDIWSGRAYESRVRALLSAAAVVLLTAGILPLEKQRGLEPLLRSMKKGRAGLFRAKLIVVLMNCTYIWLAAYGLEFAGMVLQYGLPCPDAPIRSLPEFREVPFTGTIAGYLVMLNLLRLLVLCCIAACTLALTSWFRELRPAVICSVLLFVVPAALHFIEVKNPLGAQVSAWLEARYEFGAQGRPALYIIPAAAAAAAVWAAWQSWGRTRQE